MISMKDLHELIEKTQDRLLRDAPSIRAAFEGRQHDGIFLEFARRAALWEFDKADQHQIEELDEQARPAAFTARNIWRAYEILTASPKAERYFLTVERHEAAQVAV